MRMVLSAIATTSLLASFAVADDYMQPLGTTPAATDLGHVFFTVCQPTRPALMADRIALSDTAFGWVETDLGTDAAYQTPDGAITVTLDGNALGAVCEMTIPADIAQDGADLYDDLEQHLSENRDGALPDADYTDGGVIWAWDDAVAFVLAYTETDGVFRLTLTTGDF